MERTVKKGNLTITYTLIRTTGHKVNLRVFPGHITRVYAPASVPLKETDAFVLNNAQAILDAFKEMDARDEARALREGDTLSVHGQALKLHLIRAANVRDEIIGDAYNLYLPKPDDMQTVKAAMRWCLSNRALSVINERLTHYAPIIGVTYGRYTIREQKTRWGSCSSIGNLNFNWKLILAPPEALDYVVIHELCHRKVFNHSDKFWALVESVMPEYAIWRKWLKDHGKDLGVHDEDKNDDVE